MSRSRSAAHGHAIEGATATAWNTVGVPVASTALNEQQGHRTCAACGALRHAVRARTEAVELLWSGKRLRIRLHAPARRMLSNELAARTSGAAGPWRNHIMSNHPLPGDEMGRNNQDDQSSGPRGFAGAGAEPGFREKAQEYLGGR